MRKHRVRRPLMNAKSDARQVGGYPGWCALGRRSGQPASALSAPRWPGCEYRVSWEENACRLSSCARRTMGCCGGTCCTVEPNFRPIGGACFRAKTQQGGSGLGVVSLPRREQGIRVEPETRHIFVPASHTFHPLSRPFADLVSRHPRGSSRWTHVLSHGRCPAGSPHRKHLSILGAGGVKSKKRGGWAALTASAVRCSSAANPFVLRAAETAGVPQVPSTDAGACLRGKFPAARNCF